MRGSVNVRLLVIVLPPLPLPTLPSLPFFSPLLLSPPPLSPSSLSPLSPPPLSLLSSLPCRPFLRSSSTSPFPPTCSPAGPPLSQLEELEEDGELEDPAMAKMISKVSRRGVSFISVGPKEGLAPFPEIDEENSDVIDRECKRGACRGRVGMRKRHFCGPSGGKLGGSDLYLYLM